MLIPLAAFAITTAVCLGLALLFVRGGRNRDPHEKRVGTDAQACRDLDRLVDAQEFRQLRFPRQPP